MQEQEASCAAPEVLLCRPSSEWGPSFRHLLQMNVPKLEEPRGLAVGTRGFGGQPGPAGSWLNL